MYSLCANASSKSMQEEHDYVKMPKTGKEVKIDKHKISSAKIKNCRVECKMIQLSLDQLNYLVKTKKKKKKKNICRRWCYNLRRASRR
ncbi:hypothetical protein HanIR_Chr08g0387941 [Helianthus annuus]|nr:hypothetical protein HanIR_Chr08g0387941 [Helianthus annuus]